MGYEIKMIVGKRGFSSDEWKLSTERYDDDSGFKPVEDAKGNTVYTGRKEHYFEVMAMVDLCKLGYQDDALNRLITSSHATAKTKAKTDVVYYYSDDGNTAVKEDRYGDGMWPTPIKTVLKAAKETKDAKTYRRLRWAIALLESMADDSEGLEVLFFGY